MFHSFDYPDETGEHKLASNFWDPKMVNGVIDFHRPDARRLKKEIRAMTAKRFGVGDNLQYVETESQQYASSTGGTA
jgi:CRISPR-associated protein Cas5d